MKKIVIFFFLLLLPSYMVYGAENEILKDQQEALGITDFISNSQKYTNNDLKDLNLSSIFQDAIAGKIENKTLWNHFLNILGKETKSAITNIGIILIIIIVHSLLVAISDNLGNKSVSQVAYFVEYIVILTFVLHNFSDIIYLVKESITNLIGFCNNLIPLLITLMLTTGSFTSASVIQPILLFLINFIGNFILDFILPLTMIGTVLAIVSKISKQVRIDKFAKFLKSAGVWILGIVMTLFVTVLSLEGSITETVDGVTAKTTKAAVSTIIPVVGKILGDATDAVLGCAGILKNAVGLIGIIVVIGICLTPIIQLSLLSLTYYIASCVCQPIADEKIVGLLDSIGDTFKIFLAILFCVALMIIVGLTIVIKVSNGTLLYR